MDEIRKRVPPSETVARYIFSERYYSNSDGVGRVKYGAYMPLNGETSVFRIDTIMDEEIWGIGENVGSISDRTLRARGDLSVNEVSEENLEVIEEKESHPLHANILGWPAWPVEKARIKKIAMNLADKAHLFIKP